MRTAGRHPGFRRYRRWLRRCATQDCEIELDLPQRGDDVPEIVSTAAYRIVQESLTNVARHAGTGTRASVRAVLEPDRLELEIIDDGIGVSEPPRRRRRPPGDARARRGSGRGLLSGQTSRGGIPGMGIAAAGGTMSIRVVLADDQA